MRSVPFKLNVCAAQRAGSRGGEKRKEVAKLWREREKEAVCECVWGHGIVETC